MTNPKVKCRANLKNRGEFLNDDLAAFFDFRLEFAKLLKFVELHCDAGPTVLKLKFRFKTDGVVNLELSARRQAVQRQCEHVALDRSPNRS